MKIYETPIAELTVVVGGDILTFSLGELGPFEQGGTDGPIINTPVINSDLGQGGEESN